MDGGREGEREEGRKEMNIEGCILKEARKGLFSQF
jgi:hypothetical protein